MKFTLTLNDAILLGKVNASTIIKTTENDPNQVYEIVFSNSQGHYVGTKCILVGSVREVTISGNKYTLAYPANILGVFE